MERADSQWVAHQRHRDGIDGATRSVGIGGIRFIWNRFAEVASSGASQRYGSASLRSAAFEQVAIGPKGNFVVEVGTLESERPPCFYDARDDPVRCNEKVAWTHFAPAQVVGALLLILKWALTRPFDR